MKTLELKHLAPYVSYDVKVISADGSVVDIRNLLFEGDLQDIKLVLHHLSDLAKPEWFEKLCDVADEEYRDNFINYDIFVEYNSPETCTDNPIHWPYIIVEWLFENHFDVFGLIDDGLAIDINTI